MYAYVCVCVCVLGGVMCQVCECMCLETTQWGRLQATGRSIQLRVLKSLTIFIVTEFSTGVEEEVPHLVVYQLFDLLLVLMVHTCVTTSYNRLHSYHPSFHI